MAIPSIKMQGESLPILVAVSGGVDSMVLLAMMHGLAPEHGWRLTIAHFNHQLRGKNSDADEELVRKTARDLDLPIVVGRGDVLAFATKNGVSKEMAARKLRHDFLAKTASRLKIRTIALAHHADDQVELFFLRLLRGAGLEGLAGMKWSNPSPSAPNIILVRPLLDQSKAALRKYATEHKVAFSEDASNASLDIQRNRIRHELIPLLKNCYQPALEQTILRVTDIAAAESEFVSEAVELFASTEFAERPVALQRRFIHQQLRELKLPTDFELIERLRRFPNQPNAVGAQFVQRDGEGTLRVNSAAKVQFATGAQAVTLTGDKGLVRFASVEIHWEFLLEWGNPGPNIEYFDAAKVERQIRLRHWQPGDRFQPIGAKSSRKLQDLFTNLRVPRAERHKRVVATTADGEVFWVEGLRMAEKFKLDSGTALALQWQWRHAGAKS